MVIKANLKMGGINYQFEIEDKDEIEALSKIVSFTSAPTICGLCKSENVSFDTNKATTDKGTFTYIKVRCHDCNATSTLGKYKAGGVFWKEFELYQPTADK